MNGLKIVLFARPLVVLLLLILPAVAFGHPGHGSGSDSGSVMHYLTSPMHAVPVAVGLLAAVFVIRRVLKSNSAHDES